MVVLLLVSCKPDAGRVCRGEGAVCDGDRALVCIDNRWIAARCKTSCRLLANSVKCDPVDAPQVGEACWENDAEMGIRAKVYMACTDDGKSRMICRGGERWAVDRACKCEKAGHCLEE